MSLMVPKGRRNPRERKILPARLLPLWGGQVLLNLWKDVSISCSGAGAPLPGFARQVRKPLGGGRERHG